MTNEPTFTALLVEPNEKLTHPYNLLPSQYHITRVSTIVEAQDFVRKSIPSIIFLSASFSTRKSILFLESLHKQVSASLPQLMFVVDLSTKISAIPGVSWGGNAQVISSQISAKTFGAILSQ